MLAADLSARVGLLERWAIAPIESAVRAAGLPTRIEGLSLERAIEAMHGDKKSEAGAIRFILLEDIGRAVQRTVPEPVLRATLAAGGYA